jgi:hypothetical protein
VYCIFHPCHGEDVERTKRRKLDLISPSLGRGGGGGWGGGNRRKNCPKYEDAAFCLQLFATEKVIREDRERLPTMFGGSGTGLQKKEVRVLHGG